MPLVRRLPFKRGFTNIWRVEYAGVNLNRLDRFEAGVEVRPETLAAAGVIKSAVVTVEILGVGYWARPRKCVS